MTCTATFKKIGLMLLALATLVSVSSATTPVGTVVGAVTVGGTTFSGGSLYYQFNLIAATSGVLVVKGKITGTKWTGTFPTLTATNQAAGIIVERSQSIGIPTNFVGTATLKLTVTFNKKNIVVAPIAVTITAKPPIVAAVAVNLYDVGFANNVVLDGTKVSTVGMGTPTYSWTQQANSLGHKAPGRLSASNVVAPTLTTGALTNFVDMAKTPTTIYVNDIDDTGYTNALYVVPEHRLGTIGGVSLDNEQAAEATYIYRLLVSDGSITRTGTFTVACSIQTPAHPNIPVGMTAYYKSSTNTTSWSLLSKPVLSGALLTHTNEFIAQLRPDVEGVYIIRDNTTGKTVTNTAATYVGWTGAPLSCDICHGPANSFGNPDMVSLWQKTGHATMAKLGVNGVLSSHYSESCFVCHTLGYNKAPSASSNGNFYAVEKQLGWTFPSVLASTNYAAMPQKLQNLANIQCESCHGPGSRHPGEPSVSMDVKVCSQCHQNGSNHVRPSQWETSMHAGAYDNTSQSRGTNPQCSRCHSPVGFAAIGKGTADRSTTNGVPTGTGPLSCQACHDPHNAFGSPQDPATGLTDRHQLRIYDSFLMGNPYFRSNNVYVAMGDSLTCLDPRLTNSNVIVTNAGKSAACMTCHNGRQLPMQTILYGTNTVLSAKTLRPSTTGVSKMYQTGNTHDSPVAEVFTGIGAYDYGRLMGNSFHTYLADCQTCHMYVLRAPVNNVPQDSLAIDDVVTPVTTAVYSQFSNLLGDHTFKVSYDYTTGSTQHTADNIAACNQCHASFFDPVTSFDFKSANAQDYDGDGVIAGVQTEVHGLLNNLGYLVKQTGVTITTNSTGQVTAISTSAGYATNNVVLAEAQYKAAWNWLVCYNEGSFGVHNTQFSIRLLQSTYTDLSTNYFNDVTKTFQQTFPKAYLR